MTMWTSLDPAAVAVDPGGRATARLRVRNTGDTVEEYRLSVVGTPAGWSRVEPDTLRLYPGSEGTAEISFAPPRSPDALAGPASYGIRVEPRDHPEVRDVLEGQVTVAPFTEVRAELMPATLVGRFRARASVAVDNVGNTTLTASLTLRDEANRLTYEMAPNAVQVEPGRAAFAKLTVRPQRVRWTGGTEHHRLSLSVRRSGDDTAVDLSGTFEQRAVLPRWMLVVASAAVTASVAFVMLWLGFQPKVATAAGEMQAAAGAQPVPQGSETPLPAAPSSPPPAAPPGAAVPPAGGSGGGDGGAGGDSSQVGGGPPVPPPAPRTAPKPAADAPVGPVWDVGYKPDVIVTYAQYRLATLGNECALKPGWTAAVIDKATQTSLACYQRHVMADQKTSRQLTLTDQRYGTLGRATLTSMWAQGIRPEDVKSGANNFKVRMLAASLWWANQSAISDVDLDRDRDYAEKGVAYFKNPAKGETMKADAGLASAIKEYQQNVGLKPTGVADSKTLNWLVGGAVKEPGKVGR
ncbi:peptidoglycan-binding domain-containing protein [Streptomyces sp. NPDC006632]|uniref:peptidoglycan-binding domain-containing protein n=1 Tax=unclassified Streptomyces TaxID=2593676 RepID=UPI002E20E9EF